MKSAWRLGRLSGIDVRIHWTFLLVPLWIFGSSMVGGAGVAAALVSVLFLFAIFGCVVLHELGHALTAKRFGIATRDITLLPIRGVARLARIPRNPFQEFAIAVAGPAVNVVIAAAIFLGGASLFLSESANGIDVFMSRLAWVNVALMLFNLIPAFPMDGGRILRSLLAVVLPYRRATNIAVGVGQIAATGLGLLGLIGGNFMLIILAAFVFLAATSEALAVNQPLTETLSHNSLQRTNQVASLSPTLTAQPISGRSLPGISAGWDAKSAQRWLEKKDSEEFVVFKDGIAVGVLNKNDLHSAILAGDGRCAIERLVRVSQNP